VVRHFSRMPKDKRAHAGGATYVSDPTHSGTIVTQTTRSPETPDASTETISLEDIIMEIEVLTTKPDGVWLSAGANCYA